MKKSILTLGLITVSGFVIPNFAIASDVAKSEKPAEEISVFLPVPAISVAMYNKRKNPSGTMTVKLQLKIDDDDQRMEAEKIMPRLKNAYMQETLKLSLNFFNIDRPVNVNILSRSLQMATNHVLKHDQATLLVDDIAIYKTR